MKASLMNFPTVTFHLILAIAGILYFSLNCVMNFIFFRHFQSRVWIQALPTCGHIANTITTFQMILGSWLTWTFLCLAANLFAAFEQVTIFQSSPSLRPRVQSPEGPLAWLDWDTVGSLNIIHQSSLALSFILVSIVFLGTRWVLQFYRDSLFLFLDQNSRQSVPK